MTPRRGFLVGLGSLVVTAPAIVHAVNLMPIKQLVWGPPLMDDPPFGFEWDLRPGHVMWETYNMPNYGVRILR